jgi:hypothetical protein
MNTSEIERFAMQNLSSFDGDESYFEGGDLMGYTGEGDDMLDFGGPNTSFVNAVDNALVYAIRVNNSSAASRSFYLIPGPQWVPGRAAASGYAVSDGTAFNDIGAVAGLTAYGSPNSLEEFYAFLSNNPMQCQAIKIETSETTGFTALTTALVIREKSPFRDLQSKTVIPGTYINQETYKDRLVIMPTPGLILCNQLQLQVSIPATTQVTFTFFMGAALNGAIALQKKYTRAQGTIASAGSGNLKRAQVISGASRRGLTGRRLT